MLVKGANGGPVAYIPQETMQKKLCCPWMGFLTWGSLDLFNINFD